MILHGSIVLDDTRVWEKASNERSSPWRITSRTAAAREYRGYTITEHYRRVDAP